MTTYVDNVRVEWRGKLWCHLVADSLEELHTFAIRLGLKRHWFQQNASYPHYDVTLETRTKAIELGALHGSRATIINCARRLKAQLDNQRDPGDSTLQFSLFQTLKSEGDRMTTMADGDVLFVDKVL